MAALTPEHVKAGLSQVERTLDGTGLAYSKLDVSGKDVATIDAEVLSGYPHVRYFMANGNALEDAGALASLGSLLSADLRSNKISAVPDLSTLPYFQALDLAENEVASTEGINLPKVTYLNLSSNKLESLAGCEKLAAIQRLDVSKNQLKSFAGVGSVPTLAELVASDNQIDSLAGLEGATAVTSIEADGNQLASLDGLAAESLKALVNLSLAGNQIAEIDEIAKLAALPALKSLTLEGNDVAGSDEYRQEVLIRLPKLEVLDGERVTVEERREADRVAAERAEEAAAAAAAAAAEAAEEDE